MLCPNCKILMVHALHFDSNRNYQFNECNKCHYQSKSKRIHFEDVLQEEIDKQKKK